MGTPRLSADSACLLVIDIQERLLPVMDDADRIWRRIQVAVQAARALSLPIFVTEQYPKGLGVTIAPIVEQLGADYLPFVKTTFSALGAPGLVERLRASEATSVLVVGIESHVCVAQSVLDLIDGGWSAFPLTDAISSRDPDDRRIGFERMWRSGAVPMSLEMAVFELLGDSRHPAFRELQSLIK